VINLSWGGRHQNDHLNPLVPGMNDRFYDNMVINRNITIVKSAGNRACGRDGNVTSPGLAYNIITVGNFDDRNTVRWDDDVMNPCSSWRDPESWRKDREKPEVAAPGTNINTTTILPPWTGNAGSGTSFAAPMVTGVAALLIQRNSDLAVWPEAIKAIIMATAVNNIEGRRRLSEYDGAGGIVANRADDVVRGVSGTWGGRSYSCGTVDPLDVATMYLYGGMRTRAVIAWNTDPSYQHYANQPSADLDLQIVSPSGGVVASSHSWDNTYEIVDFTPSISGNYKLRVKRFRCDLSPRWLGWAWRRGD
jgi:subtilisin family serine protease